MGYINHQAVIAVVEGLIEVRAEQLRRDLEQLVDVPSDHTMAQLLVGPIPALVNGYVTYALLPDGSKEGWFTSDLGDQARDVSLPGARQLRADRDGQLRRGAHNQRLRRQRHGGLIRVEVSGGASIAFVRMADSGKLMPCNPGADPDRGNVACVKSGALYTNGYVITDKQPLADGFVPLLAHWATCTKKSRRTPASATTTNREPAEPALF